MVLEIFEDGLMQGLIGGNQIIALGWFIWVLISGKGIIMASAVYGLLTIMIIYPSIIIYFIVKGIQSRRRR